MAQSGKIDDIRVGLGLNIDKLRSDANNAKRILNSLVGEYPIKLKLDRSELEKDLHDHPLQIGALDVSSQALADLKKQITDELGSVPIRVHVEPDSLAKMHADIVAKIGVIGVKTRWDGWEGPGPSGGGYGGGGPMGGGPSGFGGGGYGGPPPPRPVGLLGPGSSYNPYAGVPVGSPYGGAPFGSGRPGPRLLPPGRIPTVSGDVLDAQGNLILAGRAGFPAQRPSTLPAMSHTPFPRGPYRSVPNQPAVGTGRLPRPTGRARQSLILPPELAAEGYTSRVRLRQGVGRWMDSEGQVTLNGQKTVGPPIGWSEEQKADWWEKYRARLGAGGDRRLDNAMTVFDSAVQKSVWTSPAMARYFQSQRLRDSLAGMVRGGANPSGSLGYRAPTPYVDPNAISFLAEGAAVGGSLPPGWASMTHAQRQATGIGAGANAPHSSLRGRLTGGIPLPLLANPGVIADALTAQRLRGAGVGFGSEMMPKSMQHPPTMGVVSDRHTFQGGGTARKCAICGQPRGNPIHGFADNRLSARQISAQRRAKAFAAAKALQASRPGSALEGLEILADEDEKGIHAYASGGFIRGLGKAFPKANILGFDALDMAGDVEDAIWAQADRFARKFPMSRRALGSIQATATGDPPGSPGIAGAIITGSVAKRQGSGMSDMFLNANVLQAQNREQFLYRSGMWGKSDEWSTGMHDVFRHELGHLVDQTHGLGYGQFLRGKPHTPYAEQGGPAEHWAELFGGQGRAPKSIDDPLALAAMDFDNLLAGGGKGIGPSLHATFMDLARKRMGMAGGGIMRQAAPGHASGHLPGLMGMPGAVLVGERGPEVAVLPQGTAVIPNHMKHYLQQQSMADGGINYGRTGFRPGSQALYKSGMASPVSGPLLAGMKGQILNNPGPAGIGLGARGTGGIMLGYTGPTSGGGFIGPSPTAGGAGPIPVTVAGVSSGAAHTLAGAAVGGGSTPFGTPPSGRPPGGRPPTGPGGTFSPSGGAPDPEGRREARARSYISGKEAGFDLRELFTEQATRISDAVNLTPARALTVTFGQLGQELLGGRQQLRGRARSAQAAVGISSSFLARQEAQAGDLADLRIRQDLARRGRPISKADESRDFDAEIADATKSLSAFREATNIATARGEVAVYGQKAALERNKHRPEVLSEIPRATADLQADEAERVAREGGKARNFNDPLIRRRDIARSLGVGAVSLTVGSIAFTALVKSFNVGIELMSTAAGNVADQMTGYAATANKAANALAESVGGKGTGSGAALSAQFGQLGISGQLLPALSQRAQTIASAQRGVQQSDLIRANQNLQGKDALRGIFTSTGNGILPGTPLDFVGQTPAIFERFKADLTTPGAQTFNERLAQDAFTGGAFGKSSKDIEDMMNSGFLGTLGGNFLKGWNAIAGGSITTDATPFKPVTQAEALAQSRPFITNLNEQSAKAGGAQLVSLSGAQLEQSTAAIAKVDVDLAAKLKSLGLGLVGATEDGVKAWGQAVAQGMNMQSVEEVVGGLKTALTAQVRNIGRQTAFAQNVSLPANFASQMLSNPLSASPSQGLFTAGGGAGAQAGQRAFAMYGGAIDEARKKVTDLQQRGEEALRKLGVPQEQIDTVKDLGASIQGLRDKSENLRLDIEQQQWNRQMFVSKRTIGDIIGLQGRQSVNVSGMTINATKLGKIQREQLVLERESSRVALARNRREIEFQLALSRINTPGATAEERATRAREADAQAAEALDELNRNEKQRKLGIQAQNIGIDRDAKDAIYTLSQSIKERNIEFQIRGIDKVIQAKELWLGFEAQVLESSKSAGEELSKLLMSTVADVEAQTGDFSGKVATAVSDALNGKKGAGGMIGQFKNGYDELLAYVQDHPLFPETDPNADAKATASQHNGEHIPGGSSNRGFVPQASGGIKHVLGATRFMAGEAGAETVMVLRNPRAGMVSGSGGGGPTVVNLGGIAFNGDVSMDSERRVQQLAEKVERMLHQKAAMIGAMFDG